MRDKTFLFICLFGSVILISGIIITVFFSLKGNNEKRKVNEKQIENLIEKEKQKYPKNEILLSYADNSNSDWEKYDYYVFSIFWPPSSCYNKKKNGNEECFKRVKELNIENYFTVHGLWPSYISGKNIKDCTKKNKKIVEFKNETFIKEITHKWPGLYTNDKGFWSYEYNKHGYCYIQRIGKNPEKDYKIFFDKSLSIFKGYRNLMEEILPDMPKGLHNITKNKFKKLLSKSSLKLNPSSYMIKCDENAKSKSYVLNELRFYYDIYFNVFKINKSKDSCPENFQIYFSDESKKAVYEKYDFYVYSLVWNPTYCRKLGKDCNNILKQNRTNILMIHGLWPSYKNGIIPQDCNLLEDVQINISNQSLLNNLKNYWIGIGMENEEFWKYEYNKHGYCYIQRIKEDPIKNYYLYFQKTIDIYNKYNLNNLLKEMYPKGSEEQKLNRTYLSKNLDKKFGVNTYTLNCLNINERYYLYEIKLKLDLNFDFTNEGKTSNNCPEEFFAEFFEVEGPKKQHEGFMETYDIYIFSIIWLGTTCKIKGEQCLNKFKNVKKNTFTIHGLWPNYKNGTLPDWCNGKNDKEIKIKDKSLLDFMKKYYPSGYHSNEFFWGHEYNKHGYCYNQRNKINIDDYEKYFEKAKELYTKFDFENILINIYKNKIEPGDKIINRRDIEKQLDSIGITKDTYKIVCTNITNEKNVTSPHLLEIRIRFDLKFNLLKNETDVTEFDCPFLFKAFFL